MKKILISILSIVMLTTTFSGCALVKEPEADPSSVNLIGLAGGTEVTPAAEYDYFVVPEPAASTKVKATNGKIAFAGDLQALYGGGYPQAVLVVKNSVLSENGARVSQIVSSFAENLTWLLDENVSSETIVSAVTNGFLDSDMTPTFSAGNLSKEVIENSGVNFDTAIAKKDSVLTYLGEINAVSNNAWGTPVDSFFFDGNYNANSNSNTLKLVCPDGAPALSVARLLNDNSIISGLDIDVVKADMIAPFVAGNGSADLAIMPVNAASKILGTNTNYTMLGVVTNGNLFLLKKEGGKDINKDNIRAELNGKKVGVINLGNVPGLTFKAILNKYDIDFTEPQQ